MLVLFESPSGYAIFKVLDESKLEAADDLYKHFQTAENASNMLKLTHFKRFEDTTEALAATTAAVEGKVSKPLKKVLKKLVAKQAHEKLAVADAKLGQAIKEKTNLSCIYSPAVQELMRGIRAHIDSLVTGIEEKDMTAMALGLAHSLSRYKLKFSPDKVDTMIVQAISLLDDLDKELNNYIMRCREWFGWHFPEMGKVVTDHVAFAKTIKKMGFRTEALTTDFSDILPEEVEQQVKDQAQISMGTEISMEDLLNIQFLCDQIIDLTDYREQLYDYLKNRMMAIAPNLTILAGEMVGARLIAHAGSLLNLAKHPASTVQILGAEKALFRALKTRKETPKYGLIYHATMVGQSNAKNKGKISRMLAAKCALAIRYDALAEETSTNMGVDNRAKLERRLMALENGGSKPISKAGKSFSKSDNWSNKANILTYNTAQDNTIPAPKKRKAEELDTSVKQEDSASGDSEQPVVKKRKKIKSEPASNGDDSLVTPSKPKKKKKKSIGEEVATPVVKTETSEVETPKSKKKKKKSTEDASLVETPSVAIKQEVTEETPKKKKKKKSTADESIVETPSLPKKKKKSLAAETEISQEEVTASPVKKKKKKSKSAK